MSQMILTQANRNALPALYSTDGQGLDAVAQVRYFWGGAGEMLVTEFDGEDTLYGYFPNTGAGEWGYASLSEFTASNRGQINGCERDYYFTPTTVGDLVLELHN